MSKPDGSQIALSMRSNLRRYEELKYEDKRKCDPLSKHRDRRFNCDDNGIMQMHVMHRLINEFKIVTDANELFKTKCETTSKDFDITYDCIGLANFREQFNERLLRDVKSVVRKYMKKIDNFNTYYVKIINNHG
jgi:hypothetical protein